MQRVHWVDLHLHTVLSPCAELEMGAPEIIKRYREEGVSLIAVTDHNQTGNYPALRDAAGDEGPVVLPGMEVQSMEDIHAVVIFGTYEAALDYREWLWEKLPPIPNDVDIFGYQLVVDKENNVLDQEETLLIQGVGRSVDEIAREGLKRGALVIPAHLDRDAFSYTAVFGPLPDDFPCSAAELSSRVRHADCARWREQLRGRAIVRSSDAHRLSEISRGRCTPLPLQSLTFAALADTLERTSGILFRQEA
jgi:PHP family Zn ribbon phosphoesterase